MTFWTIIGIVGLVLFYGAAIVLIAKVLHGVSRDYDEVSR